MSIVRCSIFTLIMAVSVTPAEAERLYVDWEDLKPLVLGRTVSVVLPNGTVPRGRVLDVQFDQLILEVRGREPVTIGRPSVRNLMIGRRSFKWRLMGAITGLLSGLAAGAGVSTAAFGEGLTSAEAVGTMAAAAVVCGAMGYVAGDRADNATYISIVH